MTGSPPGDSDEARSRTEGAASGFMAAAATMLTQMQRVAHRLTRAGAERVAGAFEAWMQAHGRRDVRVVDPLIAERSGVTCPVCATAERGVWRRCARCDTLHHQRCWLKSGRCSMIACSSHALGRPA